MKALEGPKYVGYASCSAVYANVYADFSKGKQSQNLKQFPAGLGGGAKLKFYIFTFGSYLFSYDID